ncbi:peptidase [Achlya hypogyna]|uniref:Peptidase n=1 Tax=Achlya hypogyna TaxID=1202772 RepID=A0A1V9YQ57_ACHHY|nr:peptidase [Achlya hypogyna]
MRLTIAAVAAVAAIGNACTLIGVGSKATHDGSTMVAHTNDAGSNPNDLRLVRVPAMKFPPGAQRPVYEVLRNGTPRFTSEHRGPNYAVQPGQILSTPLGFIPQVNSTYAYWDHDYGMQNEVQLSIAESTCSCKTAGWPSSLPHGRNIMSIEELSKIALERCDTAICAVDTMGALAEEYGFFGEYSEDPTSPEYSSSCEALGIADKYGDLWLFHVLTGRDNGGAIWAAQKVADTDIVAVPNTFVIRELNLSDPSKFRASKDVASLAYEMGWAARDTPFDFTAAYGFVNASSAKPLYGGRRMWRIYDLVAPSLQLDPTLGFHARVPTYPFSVAPDALVTPESIMRILQDHYEGSVFDLTKGAAAGPFGDPTRYATPKGAVAGNWERAISMHRTTHSFVLQTRRRPDLSDGVAGLAWYAHGEPANAVYFPIACGQNSLPDVFVSGLRGVFDSTSAWWAFHFVSNWAHLRYNRIHRSIAIKRDAHQMAARVLQLEVDASCIGGLAADKCAAPVFNNFIVDVVARWWEFAWHLVGKFNDGYIIVSNTIGGVHNGGYPSEWLQTTDFVSYPSHYNPPAAVVEQELYASAVYGDGTPTIIVTTSEASVASGAWEALPPGFLLGFGCGMGVLLVVGAILGFVVSRRKTEQPPALTKDAPEVTTESV